MEKYSFFDDVNDDREYFAEDFARHLSKYFTNGIFNNELKVNANNDLTVTIKNGDANINGYRYTNTEDLIKSIDPADGVLNRIDNIVIRLDLTNRLISAQVIKGQFSNSPTAPALVRSSTLYDIKLAEINVIAGSTSITQDMITDTRYNNEVCGVVASTVQTLDTKDIFSQFESTFSTWFNNVKNQLSEDAAGNLQNQITTINTNLNKINSIFYNEEGEWILDGDYEESE